MAYIYNILKIFTDTDEWKWGKRGDPVLHIQLRDWADILLIAPLSANTLAKLSAGICDNLLTCVCRAWPLKGVADDGTKKMIMVAPAMNTAMWDHPCTNEHLERIEKWGYKIIQPISKVLMCGQSGVGAMQEPNVIASMVLDCIQNNSDEL